MCRPAALRTLVTLFALTWTPSAEAQLENVEVVTHPVRGSVSMLEGAGGNVGVCIGPDGVFLVDDQFPPLTPKIKAAVAALSDEPIRFVFNTHWHRDHVSANEALAAEGSVVIAHENVRVRMSSDQFVEALDTRVPAFPSGALPIVTFTEDVTFHVNGEEIHAFHVPNAHTDSDAVLHFKTANVLHVGDLCFNGMYPLIDYSTGGSIHGVIAGVKKVLPLCDGDTRIIVGHGPLGTRDTLVDYLRMLETTRDRIAAAIDAGRSEAEIVEADLLSDLNPKWGNGFMKPDKFVETVYRGMVR